MPNLGEILKTDTAALHERLEALPFFTALHAGTLPRPAIVSFLRALSIIHAVLERSLGSAASESIARLCEHAPPKVPLLVADIEALAVGDVPSVIPAIRGALDYAAEILAGEDQPLTLVGVLYVLEGSQNGGVVLKAAYARCLGVPEQQLSSIGCYGPRTASHWKSFVDSLNALPLDDHQAQEVSQAAVRCFEQLANICVKLYPYAAGDLKHHITAVNCEAGDHAMPQDALHVALALRAGKAAWMRYPYLEQRFGERGRRFTGSDSCWLVALTEMSEQSATKNLDWLRKVLASRGIVTVILEDHLQHIAQELAAGTPGPAQPCAHYARFLSDRDAERVTLFDGDSMTRLIEQFDVRFGECEGLTIESAARVIASAWVDERSGIPGALATVRDWFADAGRFSGGWIGNVNELVAKLDSAAKPTC